MSTQSDQMQPSTGHAWSAELPPPLSFNPVQLSPVFDHVGRVLHLCYNVCIMNCSLF